MDDGFEAVRAIFKEAAWPGVEEGTSYGTPALKVKGKLMVRFKEPGIIVLKVDLDTKEMLMSVRPEVYFETDHYKGWPAVLARLDQFEEGELREILDRIWHENAPRSLRKA